MEINGQKFEGGKVFEIRDGKLFIDGHAVMDVGTADKVVLSGGGEIIIANKVIINGSFTGEIHANKLIDNREV